MGYPIMFYISDLNREKLRDIANRSELINRLLTENFKETDLHSLSPEELARQKAILIAEIECEKKVKELQNAS